MSDKNLNFLIPENLHEKLKVQAVKEKKTLKDLIIEKLSR